ncbi:hypothetical protein NLJ89_g8219 [Agrocybe chaxingu]|uniref:Integrase catalytic domain-containing protein n=1 Tax=Agrocybe chaxingu TaxID=84603 RepID=A0A9W8JVM7_9AGAR|nr:hypothetical protein NLJ89_g8219 [Agrocybe chaxingu]
MLNEPDLQPRAAINRWIQGILMFDFTLVHVPAERHKGPDALSRRPAAPGETIVEDDEAWLDNIALMLIIPNRQFPAFDLGREDTSKETVNALPSCLASRAKQDRMLADVRKFLETLEAPPISNAQEKRRFLARATEFFIKDGQMYKRNGDHPPLLVIARKEQKLSILMQAHENLGHRGIQTVYEVLRHRFYWPYMRADVQHHIQSCHECQIRSLKRYQIPLTISAPVTLFAKIYIDLMHMPEAQGQRLIVAAKDDLSGTCEARALPNHTAESLAKFFWECIYCRYGAPQKVVTDNGSEVRGAFQQLLKRMAIPQVRILPYNHRANGVVERGHFILREAIIKACKGKITEWPDKIAEAVFADRVTINRATGFSPFQLLHGTDPVLPLDLSEATFMVQGFYKGMSTSELLALRIQQLRKHPKDLAQAAATLQKARFASKEQFERRFQKWMRNKEFRPRELVLMRNNMYDVRHDRKTLPRYLGPYEVWERSPGGVYKLKELDGTKMVQRVRGTRLVPYINREHAFMKQHDKDPEIDNDQTTEKETDSETD